MLRSTIARKRDRSAAVTVGSLDVEAVCSGKRRERVSWVRAGRKGVWGPVVERMRERVWRKRVRRWGMKNGLYEDVEDLERVSLKIRNEIRET